MRAQFLKFSILLFLYTGYSCLLFAQIPNAEDFVVTHFGMEDGLPQSSVNDIIQTKDGYIWLATFGGLVRFDGNSFTTFNRANTPGMISDRLLSIFAASDGSIWMNPELADSYLVRYKDGEATSFHLSGDLSNVLDLFEDNEGRIWLLAFNNIYLFNGEKFNQVTISENQILRSKALNEPGGIWFGIKRSLLSIVDGSVVTVFDELDGLESNIIGVYHNPFDKNELLIGSSFEGVIELRLDSEKPEFKLRPLPENYFLSLKFGNNGSQFALSVNGASVRIEDEFIPFYPFKDRKGKRIKSIIQDNEDNFWIGTGGDGLYRFKKSMISMIDGDHGLFNGKMLSITQLKNGTALFSTNCDGIFEWKDGQVKESRIHKYLEKGCYWSVFEDSRGRIWVGGGKPYMTTSIDEPGRFFEDEDGLTGYGVYFIQEDSEGNIWIGTGEGMFVYDGKSFTIISEKDGLYYGDIRSFYEDDDGLFWLGTKGGLNTYKNGTISKIKLIEPVASTATLLQPEIRAIHKDEDGAIWVGTYGNGLFRIIEDEIKQITSKDGLFDDIISHIVQDNEGNFWMGSNRGISRVKRTDLNRFLEGEIEFVSPNSYGLKDGMNSAETNGGFAPSTFTDSEGDIYFPTMDGVAVVHAVEVTNNDLSPPVYIENIKTNAGDTASINELKLAYNDAFLELSYTAVHFSDPQKIQFRYRMKGLNDNWVNAGNRRQAVFSKIPPGEYIFQVIAANSDGAWNNEGASLNITVTPPFWNTGWFYSLISLLIIGAVGFVYYRRVENLTSENERQKRFTEQLIESQESERRRIASELHDGLGQQILVIKNRVELAKNQVNDPIKISEELLHIKNSAENSIQDVRNISHALRPVHLERFGLTEALNNLAEQLQNSTQIEWSYHVDNIDNTIDKDKEINFYRVIQEATNNILKHSNASEATVFVKKRTNFVNVIIWDDGKGFVEKQKEISSLGFLGMKERIETLKGTLDIQSRLMEGTTIKIEIPVI